MNRGELVSVILSYNASSHILLSASAPTSPVKGVSNGLRMVSSSIATTSLEIWSRGFDEIGT